MMELIEYNSYSAENFMLFSTLLIARSGLGGGGLLLALKSVHPRL
jgi:hypothetical protein